MGSGSSHTCPYAAAIETLPKVPKPAEAVQTLTTGDILLVHRKGQSGMLSHSTDHLVLWDHIGMVLTPDAQQAALLNELSRRKPIAPITTGSSVPAGFCFPWSPFESGQVCIAEALGTGTYVYPLSESFVARGDRNTYYGLRKLCGTLSAEAQAAMLALLAQVWARPYDASSADLQAPELRGDIEAAAGRSAAALEATHCSELVAELYQAAGLMAADSLRSHELRPSTFAEGGASMASYECRERWST